MEPGALRSRSVYHALSADSYDALDLDPGSPHYGTPSTLRNDGHGRAVDQVLRNRQPGSGALEFYRLWTDYREDGAVLQLTRAQSLGDGPRASVNIAASTGRPHLTSRTFSYDTVGRRLGTSDPDTDSRNATRGAADRGWRYLFNPVSDLVAVRDPRGCGQNFFYDHAGRLVAEDYVGCGEAQPDAELGIGGLPNNSIGLGLLASGSGYAPDVRYYFDSYPGWFDSAEGFGSAPTSSGVLGRATGVMDRGQRSVMAYDDRGDVIWTARQMAVLPDAGTVNTTLPDGVLFVDANDTLPADLVAYDTQHTYTHGASFDHGGRPTAIQLPIDPDYPGTGGAPQLGGTLAYNARSLPYQIKLTESGQPLQTIVEHIDYTHDQNQRTPQDDFVDYRDGLAAITQSGADPMDTRPAPMLPARPDDRVASLTYEYDWLANMVEWTDDAYQFYERSLGRISNGDAETAGRPSALRLATDLPRHKPTSPVMPVGGRGGWVSVEYGEGGNMATLTTHAQCEDRDFAADEICYDALANTGARLQQLDANCRCASEQHYQYRWDEVNRLHEARRYDRNTGDGAWTLAARQRYRYDASNQRTVKQTLDVGTNAERVALYVHAGDFERRGLERSGVGTGMPQYVPAVSGAESQYLIGGARVVLKDDPSGIGGGGGALDPDLRVTVAITDLIQTSSAVVDLISGELVEASTYYPNGARESYRGRDAADVSAEPMGFTGKEADEEVGLVYFGERYLVPRLGRWASPDPLAVHAAGGGEALNAYHYVGGNLLAGRDPVGLDWWDFAKGAAKGVAVSAGVVLTAAVAGAVAPVAGTVVVVGAAAVGGYALVKGGARAIGESAARIYLGEDSGADHELAGNVVGGVVGGKIASSAASSSAGATVVNATARGIRSAGGLRTINPDPLAAARTTAAEARATSAETGKKFPTATSATSSRQTGNIVTDHSGGGRVSVPESVAAPVAESIAGMPLNPGRGTFRTNVPNRNPFNCAECKTHNATRLSEPDTPASSLDQATVSTETGAPMPRCANCQATTRGANAITDGAPSGSGQAGSSLAAGASGVDE